MSYQIVNPISLKSLFKTDKFDGIDLNFPRGSLNIILGPENSGKNDLCKKIAGLESPIPGDILYYNDKIDNIKRKNLILYFPTSNIFFENRKVIDNLVILSELSNISLKFIEKRIKKISPSYGLNIIKDFKLINLPKSIRSIMLLCLIEIILPEIVVISTQDFYGDQIREDFFFKRLAYLKNLGHTIIISTQRFSNIDNSDNIILLSSSKPLFAGNPKNILRLDDPKNIELMLLKKIEESYERIKIN